MNSQMSVDGAIHNVEAESLACVDFVASDAIIGGAFTEANQRGTAKTILLVEDESFVRKMTAEVLESAGYILVVAGTGAQALEACREHPARVDLLLADIVMPGMSGRDLAAEFESCCPSAQILLMSGYPEQLALCEPSTSGKKYLAKPFSVSMLLQRVREVLDVKLLEVEVRS